MTQVTVYNNLAVFNSAPAGPLEERLRQLSGSEIWAAKMAAGRPYRMLEDLFAAAENNWHMLPQAAIVNAVACEVPRDIPGIGKGASAYRKRFGFTLIVDDDEDLSHVERVAAIQSRMTNTPAVEIRIASDVLWRRLEKRLAAMIENINGEPRD